MTRICSVHQCQTTTIVDISAQNAKANQLNLSVVSDSQQKLAAYQTWWIMPECAHGLKNESNELRSACS